MQQVLVLTRQLRDKKAEATILNNIGFVYNSIGQLQKAIEAQLIKALQEDCSDPDYLAEIQVWDAAIADGLDNAEGF